MPKEKRDTEGWFDCIDVVSHPYDPLLVVSAYHPHLFQAAMQERTGRESHQLIGMEEEQPCGVPDETLAHKELKRTVLAGMQASSLST